MREEQKKRGKAGHGHEQGMGIGKMARAAKNQEQEGQEGSKSQDILYNRRKAVAYLSNKAVCQKNSVDPSQTYYFRNYQANLSAFIGFNYFHFTQNACCSHTCEHAMCKCGGQRRFGKSVQSFYPKFQNQKSSYQVCMARTFTC